MAERSWVSPLPVPRVLATTSCVAVLVVSTLAILTVAGRAQAAKWSDCPAEPLPVHRSTLGATSAPFVHPGHELRIVLNSAQVATSGGFSVAPDGNLVQVSFAPLFGEAVALPPQHVAAASASILSFTFPDTALVAGRQLTGPVEVRVSKGERLVALIAAKHLVALPPATDVTPILLGETPRQTVYAALGVDGDLWVPAGFHGDPMVMPGCPGDFMIPMPVEVGAASIPGLLHRGANPLGRLRRVTLYLGDLDVGETSFYGMRFPHRIALRHVAGTRGVAICQLNDALDLVLRVKGSRAWARGKRSPLRDVIRDAAAIPLELRASLPLPPKASVPWIGADSFGNRCSPAPPIANANANRR